MKIITIVGARPQFVKAAVVSRAFAEHRPDAREIIVHTGQHYDNNMSDVFFDELNIPKPIYHLGIGGGSHGQNTGRMLEAIEKVLFKEKPDLVLVYGDTDSTLSGALAAAKLHIPVAHIEAGLRSFNHQMPEELNRILTDHLSRFLFTPTDTADKNLKREGIDDKKIHRVGDVMYDAALYYRDKSKQPKNLDVDNGFILSTIHRAENTDSDKNLSEIINALNTLSLETPVILPVHPRTRKLLKDGNYDTSKITLIDPVGYLEMIWLLKNCSVVITDSGGLQKEAYFFGKLCITTRNETEWVELVESGLNVLAGANTRTIVNAVKNYMNDLPHASPLQIYGKGDAGKIIVETL